MISSNDFHNGLTIEIENNIWQIIDFQHVKPGKGAAFVRTKLRNVKTGAVVERTFNSGEKVAKARIDRRKMQYLYSNNIQYTFMDNETFEQIEVTKEQLGDVINFLKENIDIEFMFFMGKIIGIELPIYVDLKVIEADPGIKGDTATGGNKLATLETRYVVRVPLFIVQGDILKIDTRSGEYVERVNSK